MTNEKARDLLAMIKVKEPGEFIVNSWWGSFVNDYKEALQMAIEALEQQPCEDCISRQAVLDGLASIAKVKARSDAQKSLMGRIMFFVDQLPSVTPKEKTGWIPVSEILPKIGTKVLCSVNDHGGYYVIITMYNVQDYWSNGIITAWMPLPEPYKAESEKV